MTILVIKPDNSVEVKVMPTIDVVRHTCHECGHSWKRAHDQCMRHCIQCGAEGLKLDSTIKDTLPPTAKDLYGWIGCSIVEYKQLTPHVQLWMDEEYLLRNPQTAANLNDLATLMLNARRTGNLHPVFGTVVIVTDGDMLI